MNHRYRDVTQEHETTSAFIEDPYEIPDPMMPARGNGAAEPWELKAATTMKVEGKTMLLWFWHRQAYSEWKDRED